jgi:hypothetical protein
MFLFGFGQASSMLGRFAAADISAVGQRGRRSAGSWAGRRPARSSART